MVETKGERRRRNEHQLKGGAKTKDAAIALNLTRPLSRNKSSLALSLTSNLGTV